MPVNIRKKNKNNQAAGDSVSVSNGDAAANGVDENRFDYSLSRLKLAADNKDEPTFIRVYQAINWEQQSAENILTSIDSALAVGAYLAARKLAMLGALQFPNHPELKRMSTLLAPPEVTVSNREPNPGIKANRDWLRNNRAKYLECWVALRNGELLHTGHSMDELVAEIGELKNTNILVTKV